MIIDYKQLTGIKRIPLHEFGIEGFKKIGHKSYMTKEEFMMLIGDKFSISEKVDGKSSFEIKQHTHTNYLGEDEETSNTILFYEDTLRKHSIDYKWKYKKLVFDMAVIVPDDGDIAFQDMCIDDDIFETYFKGYTFIPHRNYGRIYEDELPWLLKEIQRLLKEPSQFGSPKREGIVIKNHYKKMWGKIVNPEFEENIGENYIRKGRVKTNI